MNVCKKHRSNSKTPIKYIVKKLPSTKWGANKQTLRQHSVHVCMYVCIYIYLWDMDIQKLYSDNENNYVRPTLEYSNALVSTTTHTNLATSDDVQNQALRFISGAMRTTPTSARVIECNIEPLNIRRDAKIVTT